MRGHGGHSGHEGPSIIEQIASIAVLAVVAFFACWVIGSAWSKPNDPFEQVAEKAAHFVGWDSFHIDNSVPTAETNCVVGDKTYDTIRADSEDCTSLHELATKAAGTSGGSSDAPTETPTPDAPPIQTPVPSATQTPLGNSFDDVDGNAYASSLAIGDDPFADPYHAEWNGSRLWQPNLPTEGRKAFSVDFDVPNGAWIANAINCRISVDGIVVANKVNGKKFTVKAPDGIGSGHAECGPVNGGFEFLAN